MLRATLAALGAAAMLSSPAVARVDTSSADFVRQASLSDRFEVITSKIALKHAVSPKVKAFARRMIADHTRSSQRLAAVARQAHLKPATQLDAARQVAANRLNFTTGREFDSVYMEEQLGAHRQAVTLYNDYGAHGTNYNLKRFALNTIQMLKKHEAMAADLEPKVSSGK